MVKKEEGMRLDRRYTHKNWYAVVAALAIIVLGAIIAVFMSSLQLFGYVALGTGIVLATGVRNLHVDEALVMSDIFGKASQKIGGLMIFFPGVWTPKGGKIDLSDIPTETLGPFDIETGNGIRAMVKVTVLRTVLDPTSWVFRINKRKFIKTLKAKLLESMTRAGGAFVFDDIYEARPIELPGDVINPKTGINSWHFTDVINLDPRFVQFATRIGAYLEVNRDDVTADPKIIAAREKRETMVQDAEAEAAAAQVRIKLEKFRAEAATYVRDGQILMHEAAAAAIRLAIEGEANGLKKMKDELGISGDTAYVVQNVVEALEKLPGGTQLFLSEGGNLFGRLMASASAITAALGNNPGAAP